MELCFGLILKNNTEFKSTILSFLMIITYSLQVNSHFLGLTKNPYCGCLIFIDHVKNINDLNYALNFQPDFLIRSWYRWGESIEDKNELIKSKIVTLAAEKIVGIGGGTSLSFINEGDLNSPNFSKTWISVNMDNSIITKKGRKFASLSAPGFRSYIIDKILNQVRIGVKEIHLGETNGEIHYDDWTLGLRGNNGFIHWLRNKYLKKTKKWWFEKFGNFGIHIFLNRSLNRSIFIELNSKYKENFELEFGVPGSWKGENKYGIKVFLADLYKNNMEMLLTELKMKLKQNGFSDVTIDLWGFADWMPLLSNQPDAYISSPPDERWNLNWSTNLNFNLENNRTRIKKLIFEQINSVKPTPVIYMIDHSKPFDDFKKLPDYRQAEITHFFSNLTLELGANFAFRSYSNDRKFLGPKTYNIILSECNKRKVNFCPGK